MNVLPLRPKLLSCRLIPAIDAALAASLGCDPARHRSVGLVTCDQDDSLYAALDHATKHAPVDVVYARSFYAGAAHASGPLSGEILGVIAGADSDDVSEGLHALRKALAEEICFYTTPGEDRPAFSRTSSPASGATSPRSPACRSARHGLPRGAPGGGDGGHRPRAQGGAGDEVKFFARPPRPLRLGLPVRRAERGRGRRPAFAERSSRSRTTPLGRRAADARAALKAEAVRFRHGGLPPLGLPPWADLVDLPAAALVDGAVAVVVLAVADLRGGAQVVQPRRWASQSLS
jgi:hypothetical protein